jgi:hypothetical protein
MPRAPAEETTRGSKLDSWRVMARVKGRGADPATVAGVRSGYMRSGRTKPRWLAARPTIMAVKPSPYPRDRSISRARSSIVGRSLSSW